MTRRIAYAACALALPLLLQAFALCAPARAQVVVLRVDPAAEPLCAAVEGALNDANLVPDPGYFAEAQRQGVDPSSDSALEMLIPLMNVRLAVVPQGADDQAAQIEFRDGQSGASLGGVAVPLDNGVIGWQGKSVLRREVFARLGTQPPQAAAPVAPGAPGAPAEPAEPGSPPSPETGDWAPGQPGASETDEGGAASLRARVWGGLGVGMRTLQWPENGEQLEADTGMFPAFELGTTIDLAPSDSFAVGAQLAYQSSVGSEISESHLDAPVETIGVRAHHFEGALAFTIGNPNGFYVAPALGYGTRNLRPEVHHLLTPSYSLAGPLLHVGIRIPFGDSAALRLVPEFQYVLVGDALEERGVKGSGISLGGDIALEIELGAAFALELGFREAHALLSSTQEGGSTSDVERFITARLVGRP